jgi:hypothetical protein
MTEEIKSTYQTFISKPEVSFWFPIAVAIVSFAVTWGTMTSEVKAQQKQIIKLEEEVAKYPSEEYFNLRFSNIESDLKEVKQDLKEHSSK